jgi:predicted O-methyltransferase YrrM
MDSVLKKMGKLIPLPIRKSLLKTHQSYVFKDALKELALMVEKNAIDINVIKKLIYGWGNQGYSAMTDYLETCIEYAYKTEGNIIECGSGLSTIIVGSIAQKKGVQLISFEHNSFWGARTATKVKELQLKNITIKINNLKDYGGYSWYDVDISTLPSPVTLVICDGPPAQTNGGRYGLVPQLGNLLKPGSVILMDDVVRDDEQLVMKKWSGLLNFETEQRGTHDLHAILTVR